MAKLTDDQVKDTLVSAYRESLTCGKGFTINVVLDGDNGELKTYTWQGDNISEAVFNGEDKIVKYFNGDDGEDIVQLYLSDSNYNDIIKECVKHVSGFNQKTEDTVIVALGDREIDDLTNDEINDIMDIVRTACEPDAINWAVDEYDGTVWDDVEMVMKEIDSEG